MSVSSELGNFDETMMKTPPPWRSRSFLYTAKPAGKISLELIEASSQDSVPITMSGLTQSTSVCNSAFLGRPVVLLIPLRDRQLIVTILRGVLVSGAGCFALVPLGFGDD